MPSNQSEFLQTWLQVVSPGYLEAMGFRLRAGRTVTRLDGPDSPRVLVANETLARGLFGGEPAVGRRVLIGDRDEPWEVVGVVEDIVYWGLDLTAEPRAEAFFSLAQTGGQRLLRLLDTDIRHYPDDRRLTGGDSVSPRGRSGC